MCTARRASSDRRGHLAVAAAAAAAVGQPSLIKQWKARPRPPRPHRARRPRVRAAATSSR